MSETERSALIDYVAGNPSAGDVIQGTGGVRKLRFARTGAGKRGGYRVVTFYTGSALPVFLLTVFAKNVRENLSRVDRNDFQILTRSIVENYRRAGGRSTPGE